MGVILIVKILDTPDLDHFCDERQCSDPSLLWIRVHMF